MSTTRHELPLELPEKTHTALSDYLNSGGIADLAEPLDYLLAESGDDAIVVADETGEFCAQWLPKAEKRILIVRSNIGRLAGLHLNLPVRLDEYKLDYGQLGAALSPRLEHGHQPSHYIKLGPGPAYGDPNAVLRVQQIAANELWQANNL